MPGACRHPPASLLRPAPRSASSDSQAHCVSHLPGIVVGKSPSACNGQRQWRPGCLRQWLERLADARRGHVGVPGCRLTTARAADRPTSASASRRHSASPASTVAGVVRPASSAGRSADRRVAARRAARQGARVPGGRAVRAPARRALPDRTAWSGCRPRQPTRPFLIHRLERTGKQQDRHAARPRLAANVLGHLVAGAPGHADVRKHDIGRRSGESLPPPGRRRQPTITLDVARRRTSARRPAGSWCCRRREGPSSCTSVVIGSCVRAGTAQARTRTFALMKSMMSCIGRAGQEHAFDADRLQLRDVHVGDDPADHAPARRPAPCSCSSSISRGAMCLCAPERIDRPMTSASSCSAADDDLLGRLAQAGVDHLHAGVAQRAGDHLGAPVVAVEAGLGDHDSDLLHSAMLWLSG